MNARVDADVLAGFVEEANVYVPQLRSILGRYAQELATTAELEEAGRMLHCIKGASAMIGLATLSQMGHLLEEVLLDLATGTLDLPTTQRATLLESIQLLQWGIDGVANGEPDNAEALQTLAEYVGLLRGHPVVPTPEISEPALEPALDDFSFINDLPVEETPLPVAAVPTPRPKATVEDDVSDELLELFRMEAEDHLRAVHTLLPELEKSPGDRGRVQAIRRAVHSLKGAGGVVGLRRVSELGHRMEDMLDWLYERSEPVNARELALLYDTADALDDLSFARSEPDLPALLDRYQTLVQDVPTPASPVVVEEVAPPEPAATVAPVEVSETAETPETAEAPSSGDPTGQSLRVPLERLDDLVKLIGELVITRSAYEQRLATLNQLTDEVRSNAERLRRLSHRFDAQFEAGALGTNLHGTTPVHRLKQYFTNQADFDPLEFDRYTEIHLLARELAESAGDAQTMVGELGNLVGDFDGLLVRQSRIVRDAEDRMMRLRMLPLATMNNRLHRAVRTTATRLNKKAKLVIEGGQTLLDKTVLEAMTDPLNHLLRNAVDHGLEPADLRHAMGKPADGTIRLHAARDGNQIVIRVADDGSGIDLERLRSVAVERGHLAEGDRPSAEALYQLLFTPGFSTASAISEISGRGVGLDVVKTQVTRLQGTVAIESQPGVGTTFVIRLPLTLAITRALLVRTHQQMFALPLDAVRAIHRVEREEIKTLASEQVVRLGKQTYPVVNLAGVLNLHGHNDEMANPPVVLLNAGGKDVALVVEQIVGGREVVVKNLGSMLRRVRGVAGATLTGDGSVVLILNPAELTQEAQAAPAPTWATPAKATKRSTLSVLIVDDSASVRRVVSNLIKSVGWNPILAKDGVEALELLHAADKPDVILSDIEMPRMDGYELLASLQAEPSYRSIPAVILSSRANEKHRRKALDLGARGYVVKPYQDEDLIELLRRLVESPALATVGE